MFFESFQSEVKEQELENDMQIHEMATQAPLGNKKFSELLKGIYNFYRPVAFVRVGFKHTVWRILSGITIELFNEVFPRPFSVEHSTIKKDWHLLKTVDVKSKKQLLSTIIFIGLGHVLLNLIN